VGLTGRAFPGVTKLPPDAQGALVSLVFNRGTSMQGHRRREMREIRDAIARTDFKMSKLLEAIATSIESMIRLWIGKGLDGLIRRRKAEAALVRSCI
jgi:GH24 family phage-related lysozyme (muramidase)